jgi:uncharacterized protein YfdQ (DUF2303 family)
MEQNVSLQTSVVKEWLSPKDLEAEFDIKISTQNKMRMAKKLPYSKIGKFVRYSRTKINQMFEDAEVVS